MSNNSVRVSVSADNLEDLRLLREAASQVSDVEATPVDARGVEPITTIILVGAIAAVAGVVAGWLARIRRKGEKSWGQVVDLRPEVEDPVYRDKDLEFGQIIIIAPAADEKTYEVKVEVYDPDNDLTEISKLIFGKLADGIVKPLDTLAQAAKEAVGDKGDVKVEEIAAS